MSRGKSNLVQSMSLVGCYDSKSKKQGMKEAVVCWGAGGGCR